MMISNLSTHGLGRAKRGRQRATGPGLCPLRDCSIPIPGISANPSGDSGASEHTRNKIKQQNELFHSLLLFKPR